MKKGLIPGLTFVAALALAAAPALAQDQKEIRSPEVALAAADDEDAVAERSPDVIPFEEAPSHIFLTHEEHELKFGFGRDPLARRTANMTYHGGKIMPTVVSKAIFWGPSWTNSTFVADKITGLDSWYTGHSGSNYAATVDEYSDTVNGGHQVGSTGFLHQGHIIDTSTATGGNNTSAILAEVCKQITAGNIVPDAGGNGYYPVYTDVPRGSAGFCAWHSAGTCNGQLVQFAFFFNLDGDAGCDPQDTSGLHSQGLAALANVTAHEVSEARSDPASPGAWYDSRGAENGDKCAWTFNVPLVSFPNGTAWKLQGEWSNAAYSTGTGYPNSSGQRGCLDGH